MVLCYQAYGLNDVVTQTMFSAVSLLRFFEESSPIKIVIYTDMRGRLDKFFENDPRVELVEISAADIRRWRGAIDFVHRVKLEVLKDCSERYPGPLFYCDGDTYFSSNPLQLFDVVNDQTSLMHIAENKIDEGRDPLSRKIAKFLRANEFTVNGQAVRVPPSTVMWNAGVIGVSQKNCSLFAPMIALTDTMHSLYQKHVMEQLAVSFYLQRETRVLPSDAVIFHYWDQKPEYQKAIDEFFGTYPTLKAAVANYNQFAFPKKLEPKLVKRGLLDILFFRN